jgi:hypothetical protein
VSPACAGAGSGSPEHAGRPPYRRSVRPSPPAAPQPSLSDWRETAHSAPVARGTRRPAGARTPWRAPPSVPAAQPPFIEAAIPEPANRPLHPLQGNTLHGAPPGCPTCHAPQHILLTFEPVFSMLLNLLGKSRCVHPLGRRPGAAFVTRLRSSRSPGQTARQLPEQSTTLWVEPPSTGETRHRGALQISRR